MSSETITSLSSTIVKTTEEAVKLVKTKEEIISQVNLVKGNVKLLETAIKSIIGSQEQTENPLRLEGNLALLKYYLAKLQYLLHASSKVGGGLDNTEKKQRSRHLVWHSINSCFKGRVCTGLIANLSIKDPLCFLNKAFNNFQRKIKTHRQKSMLKVNVVLVCNFIKPQSGDIDKKTFATKNHTIDINTNLKTWYRDNVIQTLANKLEEFSEKDSGEYSDLYLKNDVLLLADIFENFRRTCLLTYELDTLHFYTAPGLAFDAMLKTTGVQLELLSDIEKLMFIERGIRGGVSQCSNRYAKANNKYMKDEYDSNQESTYLMYFDINNLYGAAMSEYLPYGEFEFLEANEIENLDIMNISDNAEVGYIFDCDLEYPTYLHQLHSDLPLAPQHMTPPIPSRSKLKKLLLTLYPKNNYVVHYRNLKMYLKHGLRLKKINRVLRFKQSPWLKKYIDLNTTLRQQAKNDFDKNFYKLMINSVYGKLMENVRKYRDVRMTTKWEGRYGAQNYIAKPNFHSCSIFDDDMIIIEMNKLEILFNKPIQAVLNISKTFLYEFHYDYILPKFQDKAKLLYTDTDSLIYQLNVPDIYEHIKEDSHRFDTSDYEPNNPYGIEQKNKKVPGLMKDENNGQIMLEFVGLRAKMYAYKVHNDKIVKRSKGSTLASVKKISFDDYKRTLFDHEIIYKPQHLIRSKKHCVFTIRQNKMILNPFDDKRVLNSKSTDTKPWGYERISEDADDLPNKRICIR
ncbi:hypothetical protein NQ315_006067 [Exocentrus adspersus]|uniref:DNA-directed DNA polymerase n=1 Tax=Exocentrus adspersus TaxID=1586481 RepID=A0AAV8VG38_9CUCU|nr:hypothetical protein NQ315_006067 [Exocentrus adspersus]